MSKGYSIKETLINAMEPDIASAEDVPGCRGRALADGTKTYRFGTLGSTGLFFFNAPVPQGE